MARPKKNFPGDVRPQRLYLGSIERGQLHALAKHLRGDLSMAARYLIQQGTARDAESLAPGEHAVTTESEDFRKVEVRCALDLRNAAHRDCFKRLLNAIEILDRGTAAAPVEPAHVRLRRLKAEKALWS